MKRMILSEEEEYSEKTKSALSQFIKNLENWRGGTPISDDLIPTMYDVI